MLWLYADKAARQQLRLPPPTGGKPRAPEEAEGPKLVDFDYQCFGEKGCWLTAAFAGGGSAPALLLAKRLHGTHEQKPAPDSSVGDGPQPPSQSDQGPVAGWPRE